MGKRLAFYPDVDEQSYEKHANHRKQDTAERPNQNAITIVLLPFNLVIEIIKISAVNQGKRYPVYTIVPDTFHKLRVEFNCLPKHDFNENHYARNDDTDH
jgi:hypothetical protein